MKRGGPLKRLTPLKNRTGLSRARFLNRTPLTSRRPVVTKAERDARKTVKQRSEGRCEIGGTCRATDMHHRQNRSQGGQWTPENLLHVCRAHHQHVTVNPQAAREQGWTVPSHRDPAQVPVWLAGRGYALLRNDGSIDEFTEEDAA